MGVVPTVSGARPSHRPLHNGGRSTIVTLQDLHCWTTSQDFIAGLYCRSAIATLQDFIARLHRRSTIVTLQDLHCWTTLEDFIAGLQCRSAIVTLLQDCVARLHRRSSIVTLQDYTAILHCKTIYIKYIDIYKEDFIEDQLLNVTLQDYTARLHCNTVLQYYI